MRLRLLLLLLAPLGAQAEAARFAVVVGSNTGAPGRPRLWFAERDAERFRSTLVELGDFAPDHALLLKGVSAQQVRAAMGATEAEMAAARR